MIVNFPCKGDVHRPTLRSAFAGAAAPRLICRWTRDASGRLVAQWIAEQRETGLHGAERPPSPRSRFAA
ncbi:hypothetical protein CCR94_07935 [Rhodoblastus sphagnicola]|uniref:Uncharacterized protein n=1 Tax=Rhodoblastus sphagnicola TaxID=333368 RepID=A0A2S6NBC0_9HYPH|nr:hypothetical protein [Rhodoblastus sphagnicola]MBB4197747.1 hypothetical protein [Rhodoblastus sphagnicola]PPQ31891.1 hypothetical protein CCR94_07935 [Rhodoblastus sphagnicola]